MGNGFPVAGNLIAPHFAAKYGMLGTTFGGNQLSCAAAIAVLDVIKSEDLLANSLKQGAYLSDQLEKLPHVREVRGRGLMIGVELEFPIADLRNILVNKYHIFTGNSSNKNTLRILPALNVQQAELDVLLEALAKELKR
jgi:acetylornithine aminotransferase